MIKCPICGAEIKRLKSHWNYSHKDIDYKEYISEHPEIKTYDEESQALMSKRLKDSWNSENSKFSRDHYAGMMSKKVTDWWHNDKEFQTMRSKVSSRTMSRVITKLNQDPEFQKRRHLRIIEQHKMPSWRKKSSDNLKKRWIGVTCGWIGGRGKICVEGYYVRSSYEASIIKWLLENEIEFEYESYKFPYEFNGSDHTYIPDLFLAGKFFEIKPRKFWKDDLVNAKLEAVRSSGYEIYLIEFVEDLVNILESSTTIESISTKKDSRE